MNSFDLQKIFKRSERTPWQTMFEETIIIDPDKNFSHELNPVGGFVWEKLDGTNSIKEVVQLVGDEFEIDATSAERDLQVLLRELLEKGLVTCLN